jgi:rhodanese-related sulfurtransferase
MRDVATAHVADLDQLAVAYPGNRDGLEEITREELAARLQTGEVIVLDVRNRSEFDAGHIQGARSVPITELRKHLRALPHDTEIVAYCRGPYCVYADDAVRQLRKRGYQAARLQDGYPEWQRAGLPVVLGTNK